MRLFNRIFKRKDGPAIPQIPRTEQPTIQTIYDRFYSDYPEKPYISDKRNIANWIEQMEKFPKQNIIPQHIMRRYSDGLLPGHICMLYWINKQDDKTIPSHFEYKYGLNFEFERQFLKDNGYLNGEKLSQKGKLALQNHAPVVQDYKNTILKINHKKYATKTCCTHKEDKLINNGRTLKALSYQDYLRESEQIYAMYLSLLEKIQKNWSVLYNTGNYRGEIAKQMESDCIEDIKLFEIIRTVDLRYGQTSPQNIPAFKRLAMLYEKQGKYEDSIIICKKAYSYGMDERERMARMIKKAGRKPTSEELIILNK